MMYPKVLLDGRLLAAADASLPLHSAAVLYGAGAFTTLRISGGLPFMGREHHERLRSTAARVGLGGMRFGYPAFQRALAQLAAANRAGEAVARISISRGPEELWSRGAARATHWWILLKPAPDAAKPLAPARLSVSPWAVHAASPLAGLKLHNYLEPRLALAEARACKSDEAVRINERGDIAGACHAALLWRRGGRLFAPGSRCGGVASTTLDWAIAHLREGGTTVARGGFSVSDLRCADEILLLSSGVGIRAVSGMPGARVAGAAGELFHRLHLAWRQALGGLH